MPGPNIFLFVFCFLILFYFFELNWLSFYTTQEVTVSLAKAKEVSVDAASSG